jgi:hypothetical protein
LEAAAGTARPAFRILVALEPVWSPIGDINGAAGDPLAIGKEMAGGRNQMGHLSRNDFSTLGREKWVDGLF